MGFEEGMLVAIWRGPKVRVVGMPVEEPFFSVGIIEKKDPNSSDRWIVRVDEEKDKPQRIREEKMEALLPFPLPEKGQDFLPTNAALKYKIEIMCALAFSAGK